MMQHQRPCMYSGARDRLYGRASGGGYSRWREFAMPRASECRLSPQVGLASIHAQGRGWRFATEDSE